VNNNNMKKLTVAIDGPAGAGKSTVAQIVARRLHYTYIDTGAMYRAVTWKVLQKQLKAYNKSEIIEISGSIDIKLDYSGEKLRVFVDGKDVTADIRTPLVTGLVAEVARIPEVRRRMIALQRKMAEAGGVVMDGRDICTYVLPDAEVKIFLTASIDERANRRWRELQNKGFDIEKETIRTDIICRDKKDCEREIAPLIQAPDAILVDTTNLSIEDAVQKILCICRERKKIV
jgi:cytidylate kinase